MSQELSNPNPQTRLEVALELAKAGNFVGIDTIIDALASGNEEVRSKAAYYCARIGFSTAIEPLSYMVAHDSMSDNRNQAIFALVGIGRPAVVPALIAALDDEEDDRREDARVALYRVVGKDILQLLADDDGGDARDPAESGQVAAWWQTQSARFDPALVYAMGELASPGLFIRQLKTTRTSLPDAILNALHDWTGNDLGQSPLPEVIAKWEKWWTKNDVNYEEGRRYFYGHPVP